MRGPISRPVIQAARKSVPVMGVAVNCASAAASKLWMKGVAVKRRPGMEVIDFTALDEGEFWV